MLVVRPLSWIVAMMLTFNFWDTATQDRRVGVHLSRSRQGHHITSHQITSEAGRDRGEASWLNHQGRAQQRRSRRLIVSAAPCATCQLQQQRQKAKEEGKRKGRRQRQLQW